jgi:internalin A
MTAVDFAQNRSSLPSIQNKDLKVLAEFPKLKLLELGHNSAITDAGLIHLKGLQIETLYLYRTGVEGPGLRVLQSLPQLKAVCLDYTALGDEGMQHLCSLNKLSCLDLNNTKITDDGLRNLSSVATLERLTLRNTLITDTGLGHLRQLTGLKELGLSGTNVTAAGVRKLQAALPGCQITPTVDQLSAAPEDVSLWEPDDSPTRAELLEKIEEIGGSIQVDTNHPDEPIVYFMLFDSNISDASLLRLLAEMPDLEELNLRHVLVGDTLAESLPYWPNLRFISLGQSRITDAGLPHFSRLHNLKELVLNSTRIGDDGIESLCQLHQLESLEISDTWVTTGGAYRLRQALPACSVKN